MPISFKSERKKTLKQMYNDICDAYVESTMQNPHASKEEKATVAEDAAEWKIEFATMLNDI